MGKLHHTCSRAIGLRILWALNHLFLLFSCGSELASLVWQKLLSFLRSHISMVAYCYFKKSFTYLFIYLFKRRQLIQFIIKIGDQARYKFSNLLFFCWPESLCYQTSLLGHRRCRAPSRHSSLGSDGKLLLLLPPLLFNKHRWNCPPPCLHSSNPHNLVHCYWWYTVTGTLLLMMSKYDSLGVSGFGELELTIETTL